METLVDRIHRLGKEKGWTLEEFEMRMGLARWYDSEQWLLSDMMRIARAFDMSLAALLDGTKEGGLHHELENVNKAQLTLEEVRLRLAEIPAEQFGETFKTSAIGQIYRIKNGERWHTSADTELKGYPRDVAWVMGWFNCDLSTEHRKALAMMLPLPEAFPELTPERAIKLAAWAGEKALGYYDGPGEKALEQAVDLAKRAAAGETYTRRKAKSTVKAVEHVRWHATLGLQDRMANAILNMAKTLAGVVWDECWSAPVGWALWGIIRTAYLSGGDWREWLAEYLRLRTEA